MKSAKIGALFMVAVIGLTAVGVSYSHWEEKLHVKGIMYTDDIDPCFENAISNDPPWEAGMENDEFKDPWECGEWPMDCTATNPWDWMGIRKNKDVGSCEITIDPDDCTQLAIFLNDTYPCYYAHPYWEVVNYGSVPVNLQSYLLTNLSFSPNLEDDPVIWPMDINMTICKTYLVRWNEVDEGGWEAEVVEDDGTYDYNLWDFTIHPTGDFQIGDQLDPNYWQAEGENGHPRVQDEDPCYVFHSNLCIHFLNGCRQLAHYDFDIEMVFWNWPAGDEGCAPEQEQIFHNADLMLVLDNSGSINESELATYKTAAHGFVAAIHSDNATTGQTHFNTNGGLDLHLTMYETRAHTAITNLPSSTGWTNLYEGLNLAYEELMLGTYDMDDDVAGISEGDREPDDPPETGYPDYIVVITDGQCNRPQAPTEGPGSEYTDEEYAQFMAKDAADDCDIAGIEIFALGVGIPSQEYEDFLEDDIATSPDHYFSVDNWEDLEDILTDLVG